eukprot:1290388-Rhodomonas_salina.1
MQTPKSNPEIKSRTQIPKSNPELASKRRDHRHENAVPLQSLYQTCRLRSWVPHSNDVTTLPPDSNHVTTQVRGTELACGHVGALY